MQSTGSDVAREFDMSPTTLRRRLEAELTSYQDVKDAVRRDAAVHYLCSTELSVAEIGALVGFQEPSAFGGRSSRGAARSPVSIAGVRLMLWFPSRGSALRKRMLCASGETAWAWLTDKGMPDLPPPAKSRYA